ncbi:MAG: flagellar basal body L-ring protein FlgH [Deltaproteobacteria bacterium]|nr:flagellar basal body L-ring protein FlgH [Deltaproteobacteria bacterium]MBW2648974.1 flagellar basal body L-ring protein FlgH [Deltaproteobacteria bacterium]
MKSNNNNHSTTRLLNKVLLGILFVLVVAGCSSNVNMVKKDEFIPVPEEKISRPPTGSIWPGENAKNSLFTDNKARHVDDIITIVIDEYSSGSNSANTTTGRDTKTLAGISSLLGLDRQIARRNKDLTDGEDINTAGLLPSIQVGGSSKNSLTGKGKTSRDGKLEARITARVVRVLSNGNLAIEGRRRLTVNAEDQYIVVSGIIRPEDITSDNIISSRYIADARIVYTGKGVINDKMRPGWMTRIVDWTWPF